MPHVRGCGERPLAPLVSFLTSAYQTEQYVSETIESVLAQTRDDWQLIVVDNGNSEEMARIVGAYTSDPRITLIRQENKGIGGGFRAAANAAGGRYVCALASDDALDPHYCERIGALVDADPRIDAVGSNGVIFWEPDTDDWQKPRDFFDYTGRKTTPNSSKTVTFTELLDEGIPPYAGAIRREAWDAHGGFEPSADIEPDVALWLRLVAAGHDVRILPDRLIRTRMRADSSSRDPASVEEFLERLQRTFLLVGQEEGLSESAIAATATVRRLRYTISLRRARSALVAGDVQVARTAVRDALKQQRTVRAAAVFVGLQLSPGLLARIHPAKNRIQRALRQARSGITRQLKHERPARPEPTGVRTPLESQP